ncbi:MAG TPA: hypothetical protein VHD31_03310 [Candidatus Paceibacterota bacterium]|nr:hypothetical protein [Candidatus Paceibacterota bacterium]
MKLQFFAGFLVAVLALVGVWAYSSWDNSKTPVIASNQEVSSHDTATSSPVSTSTSSNPTAGGKKSPTAESITGTIACLPHKGDGPHTMECAIGLKTDSGQYYALTTFNYPSDADVGDHVRLTGVTVTTDQLHLNYDTVGTFQVASTQKL